MYNTTQHNFEIIVLCVVLYFKIPKNMNCVVFTTIHNRLYFSVVFGEKIDTNRKIVIKVEKSTLPKKVKLEISPIFIRVYRSLQGSLLSKIKNDYKDDPNYIKSGIFHNILTISRIN